MGDLTFLEAFDRTGTVKSPSNEVSTARKGKARDEQDRPHHQHYGEWPPGQHEAEPMARQRGPAEPHFTALQPL